MLDFNSAPLQQDFEFDPQRVDRVKQALRFRAKAFVEHLFPAAVIRRGEARVGSLRGEAGDSLWIKTEGEDAGRWRDHATDEQGGDFISLYARAEGMSHKDDFPEVLKELESWLGISKVETRAPQPSARQIERESHKDDPKPNAEPLGAPTQTWHYLDENSNIIASVKRYDLENGSKTYRPWDARAGKHQMPEIRPLYNLPNIMFAEPIVLVEGEKSADALIRLGYAATTAMGGAHAPLDKTDWTALKGKRVIMWPDADKAGQKYASNAPPYLEALGCTVTLVTPPEGVTEGWDAADAVKEGVDVRALIDGARSRSKSQLRTFTFGDLYHDESPDEPDLIGPGLMAPGEMLLIAGPPKSMKSLMLQDLLVSAALGRQFLGFDIPRPLRCYWLQAEMTYKLLKRRAKAEPLTDEQTAQLSANLAVSDRFAMLLDAEGEAEAARAILDAFNGQAPDIIAFDPLANMFDGENENDNAEMMRFLKNRIEGVRRRVSPATSIALVHHANKTSREMMERDPFNAIRGAGALRGYYTSAMMIWKPDDESENRRICFEFRDGRAPEPMSVVYRQGRIVKDAGPAADVVSQIEFKRVAKECFVAIERAFKSGSPLSPFKQSGPRFALTVLPTQVKAKPQEVDRAIKWLVEIGAVGTGSLTAKGTRGYCPLDASKLK